MCLHEWLLTKDVFTCSILCKYYDNTRKYCGNTHEY